ncbi:MAG: hypothetical protein JWP00_3040 [Chloroflexi bacterium]|nr:hypothetical protein [Chloroflexota bacterium]
MTISPGPKNGYKPVKPEAENNRNLPTRGLETGNNNHNLSLPAETFETGSDLPLHRLAIACVKLIHTAIFALVSFCILYVFESGLRTKPGRWTVPAILIVSAEMAVFAGNRGRCPLTLLTEKLGAHSGHVTDIFLPKWFAQRIPQIYTPIFISGLVGLLWHKWRGHNSAKKGEAAFRYFAN